MVTPRSLTCSLGVISCPLMLRHSVFFLLSPKSIILNFEGLTLMPLAVYHSNTSCRSLSSLITIESIFESQVIYSISSLVRQAYFGTAVLVAQHDSSTALFQGLCCSCAEPNAYVTILHLIAMPKFKAILKLSHANPYRVLSTAHLTQQIMYSVSIGSRASEAASDE